MCSTEEQVKTGETPLPRTRRDVVEGLCHKCKRDPPVVDMKRVMYCKLCFTDSVLYRYKGNIMKAAKAKEGAKLMVGFSGGPSSRLLLHATSQFHTIDPINPRKRRKFSDVVVCYVDQSALLGGAEKSADIERIARTSGFTYVRVPLENAFTMADGSDAAFLAADVLDSTEGISLRTAYIATSNLSPAERLRRCVNGLGKLSSKEDLIQFLTLRALLHTAMRERCSVLAVGDNATRMAVKVLAAICKGRGLSVPSEVAVDMGSYEDVVILRPLRDILAKEVAAYNQYECLETVVLPSFTTAMPSRASIDRLTEDFVNGLQRDFPMTVNTVIRTAGKVLSGHWDTQLPRCPICAGFIQVETNRWRAKHTVFTLGSTLDSREAGFLSASSANIALCSNSSVDIVPHVCYSCQNLCRDAQEASLAARRKGVEDFGLILPSHVGERIESNRKQIAKEIMEDMISTEGDIE